VKIAIVTDDGQSISAHFGRAPAYAVITVEDGVVVGREIRPKAAPHLDAAGPHGEIDGSHDSRAAHARHDQMIAPITDCACLVVRGMGRGAYDRVTSAGIRAIVTDLVDPEPRRTAALMPGSLDPQPAPRPWSRGGTVQAPAGDARTMDLSANETTAPAPAARTAPPEAGSRS
jgi:predicted Fe-Mo cluster-binding NifX family protein